MTLMKIAKFRAENSVLIVYPIYMKRRVSKKPAN